MFRFIETIQIFQGQAPLIDYHQKRYEMTQKVAFGKVVHPPLATLIADFLEQKTLEPHIRYKYRIVYDPTDIQMSCQPYTPSTIEQLKVKIDHQINYHYKYADRSQLEKLTINLASNTEALIVKDGLLTDTTFTNIALFDGIRWFTPQYPLLKGVQRAFLIEKKIIHPKNIKLQDIPYYSHIKLFNAMNSWEDAWLLSTQNILL